MKKEMQKSVSRKLFLGLFIIGVLFMALVCVGRVSAEGSLVYGSDNKIYPNEAAAKTAGITKTEPVSEDNLLKATNLKDNWGNSEVKQTRKDAMKAHPDQLKSALDGGQVTPEQVGEEKDYIKKNPDIWNGNDGGKGIRNSEKAGETFEKIFPESKVAKDTDFSNSKLTTDKFYPEGTGAGKPSITHTDLGQYKTGFTKDGFVEVDTANARVRFNGGEWKSSSAQSIDERFTSKAAEAVKSTGKPSGSDPFGNNLDPFNTKGGAGGTGSSGGASDAAGAAGDAQSKMKEAFGMAQQMVGLAKEFLSGLQANLQSDAEQKSKTGTSAVELQAAAQEGVIAVENAQVQLATSSTTVDTTSPNPNGKATFTFDSELKVFTIKTDYPATAVADTSSTGAGALITNDNTAVAGILSPSSTTTTVTNDADSTTPLLTTSASNVGTVVAFLTLAGYVVNDVVNGQNVKFIKQDIEINGNDIIVYALKPFSHIEGGGKGIILGDGSVDIKFEEEKTLYPRTIKENEFFINKLTNKQDPDKYFALIPGGTAGNYFLDNKKRISVGDNSVEHPALKGVKIAEIRKDMWKK